MNDPQQDEWHNISVRSVDPGNAIKEYQWRGVTPSGWPREVRHYDDCIGWYEVRNVNVKMRIAKRLNTGDK